MHCVSDRYSVGFFLVERNSINEAPPYQRHGAIWSKEKQQLFIDSIFNGYDVPKIYLHDIRGLGHRYNYAIIDGRQRLDTIWRFLDGGLALAGDFRIADGGGRPEIPGGSHFAELAQQWQELFKSKNLDVVLVQQAEEDDIEELFSRLNNGEPLNAAEKRNAMGGRMCELIRDLAENTFFTEKLPFGNQRYQYYEIAAKLLLLEKTEADGGSMVADLKKKFLDKLVEDNRVIPQATANGLKKRVETQLKIMSRVFSTHDSLLNKQAYPPLYYIFVKLMQQEYADGQLYTKLHSFLEAFHTARQQNNELPEDDRDPVLIEFDRLMQQGTNDLGSLNGRIAILRRYFLNDHPEVEIRDRTRSFTEEERMAIWVLGGKQCGECGRELHELGDMHADHQRQWAHGGATTLANGALSMC